MRSLVQPLLWAAAGALLILVLSQIPAAHPLDVGGYDAAYIQGFHEPEQAGEAAGPRPHLDGGDGTARWSTASAALIFPQAGLPGEVTLRLRGWRAEGPLPTVTLLLNGATELARFQASGDWEEQRLRIAGGWLKASDFFIEIRAETAALADGREVGVLVDRASYRVGPGPTAPYPSQLIYGAAVGALLWALAGRAGEDRKQRAGGGSWRSSPLLLPAGGLLGYGLAWLLLYRLQPPLYPYPLRALPPLSVLALVGALALRGGPALAARLPRVVSLGAPLAMIGAWTAATLWLGAAHVTLSRPGVENDFRVFATRESLAQVFSADGFYNLGYPLLLWLARPLADGNAFLAGRLVAALSGAIFLAAGYWLARTLLPPGPALVALLALALSGLVAQYGLYVGSDMPFAACVALCVAAVIAGARGQGPGGRGQRAGAGGTGVLALVGIAGLFGGAAFLMRHLGLVLLPWGALVLIAAAARREPATGRLRLPASGIRYLAAYTLAFLIAMAPQLAINTAQAGQPLYNQQAKNIWLAVYGGTDWGRWDEAPNTISLAEVVLRDPARFLGNWWRNMVGYVGSGAEDTSEFGRALQLRLLGWPANWLAVAGLLGWLLLALRAIHDRRPTTDPQRSTLGPKPLNPDSPLLLTALLMLILIYVAAVSTAFTLQRFFLPLAPIYALAAGWAVGRLARGGRALLGAALALSVVLWGGYGAGARYVIANQPADEVAAVAIVRAALPPDSLIAARVGSRLPLAKYSALAHRVVDWPAGSVMETPVTAADLEAARAAGASYLLWDEATGPPPLAAPEAARTAGGGRYALYRLEP